ncbi:L-amino acid N-acyltransferase YncA [Gillisia sp. Hel_I_86]|uniref:GNAT family N-acetyltransferase n=1 Tax=Gillisia sp. Hel_I_86 TaxID=1249981 RepID=UPI00119BD034|nr:GNAT family N-acetyltransferase [Gillisia sp. Hel_I_86]TVZ28229.1 L-amino acid N-acyltransferase YncA [Gillisia sp. Hel_I_86]
MQIREATDKDIPGILEVLKASLGETSSKKTEEVWRYKHVGNPFGRSLVLLAVENNEIIGIRAFMSWKWQKINVDYLAYRAVDTATHPSHQGKGVFKKLTLAAIDIAKSKGVHLIFNTPNVKSKPGYIKMGWEEVGKLNIRVVLNNPFKWSFDSPDKAYETNLKSDDSQFLNLISEYNSIMGERQRFFTPKSLSYLLWRYENNPLQGYEILGDEDFYMAAYVKKHKYFKELRVTDQIFTTKLGRSKVMKTINTLSIKHGTQIVTASNDLNSNFGFSGNFGPVLTLKNLNLNIEFHKKLLQINNWNYSLGDLELF